MPIVNPTQFHEVLKSIATGRQQVYDRYGGRGLATHPCETCNEQHKSLTESINSGGYDRDVVEDWEGLQQELGRPLIPLDVHDDYELSKMMY